MIKIIIVFVLLWGVCGEFVTTFHVCLLTDLRNMYHMISGLIEVNALLTAQANSKVILRPRDTAHKHKTLPMYFYLLSLLEKHHRGRIITQYDSYQPYNGDKSIWCNVTGILSCSKLVQPTRYSRIEAIFWFNNTVRSHVTCMKPLSSQRMKVLIIQRARQQYRSIINMEDVENILYRGGGSELQILQANTSVLHQLCLPLTRPKVLAVHGAALSLFSFFASPNHKLLELMPFGYNAPPYISSSNPRHLSLQLDQSESVFCTPKLQPCTEKEGPILGKSWKEVAQLWWPNCRSYARSCNIQVAPKSLEIIQHFFNDKNSMHVH